MDRARRMVVGCMTGTSIDALDAALVEIEGTGLQMTASVGGTVTRPLGGLAGLLRAVAEQRSTSAADITRLSREFALLHAEAVQDLLREAGLERPDLIAVHGQTVFHAPPLSWQIFNAFPVAQAIGCPVVFDLRGADLAAGGQGAPITPLADWVLFRHVAPAVAVVNLGGFCNITWLGVEGAPGPEGIHGCDLCACNHLLDAVAREVLKTPYDRDGAAALRGTADTRATSELRDLLTAQVTERRSLGTSDELGRWVERYKSRLRPDDLANTAAATLGGFIARGTEMIEGRRRDSGAGPGSWEWGSSKTLLAGGGVWNACLVQSISQGAGTRVQTTDEVGIPAAYREAICMAVLGALCQDRVPITLPRVTGVREPAPIAGCWVLP